MNSKFLKLTNKIIAITIVILICSTSVVSAFSFDFPSTNGGFGKLSEILSKIFSSNSYKPEDLEIDLTKMKDLGNFDLSQIEELIGKLGDGDLKDKLSGITDMFPDLSGESGLGLDLNLDLSGLLDTLLGVLGGSFGNTLPVEPVAVEIPATTAKSFNKNTSVDTLKGSIYVTNQNSNKWVVVIHPFLFDGKAIANKVAPFYCEKDYNVLAPDLRGMFGETGGGLSLGFLDSLDIYDWLCYLNDKHNAQQIMIHGVSIGGATTNFVSGIDGMLANSTVEPKMKLNRTLSSLNVIGLVEDSGFANMEQFASKDQLSSMGDIVETGLTDENFEYYSDATNSLKYCKLPMFIIHGTADTTVDPENAEIVEKALRSNGNTNVETWIINGGQHAAIAMGIDNNGEYGEKVHAFIDKCEGSQKIDINVNVTAPTLKTPEKTPAESTNFLQGIMDKLKGLFKR